MDRYNSAYEHMLDEFERVLLLTEAAIRRGWAGGGLHHALTPELSQVLGITTIEPVETQRQRLASLDVLMAEHAGLVRQRTAVSDAAELRLPQLRERFGLDDFQLDIVVLALAPEIDPRFSTLINYMQGARARWLDVHIVGEILCRNAWQRRRLFTDFAPDSPLIANHLIELMRSPIQTPASLLYRPIRANNTLLDFAVGKAARSAPLETLYEAGPCDVLTDDRVRRQAERLSATLAQNPSASPLLVLSGGPGLGKRTLLRRIAGAAGLGVLELRASTLPDEADACSRRIHEWLLRGALYGHVCYATQTTQLGEAKQGVEHAKLLALTAALESYHGAAALEWQHEGSPFRSGKRPVARVLLTMPSSTTQALLWKRALASVQQWLPNEQVQELTLGFHLAGGTIFSAVQAATSGSGEASFVSIERAVQNIVRGRLDDLATRIDRLATWDDLLVGDELRKRIRAVISQHRHRHTVLNDWAIGKRLRLNPGLSVLFWGPPGTGKSMAAGLVARELGFELYQVDLAMVMSKWMGETEKNLARIFDEAEAGQVVLLFDEADSLFSKRVASSDSPQASGLAQRVNYILTRLERFRGVAILTSNRETAIDDAFERRLSAKINFPMPPDTTRRRLWQHLLGSWDPDHLDELASVELAGGHIRNVCAGAAFDAAGLGATISAELIEGALTRTLEDMGRLPPGWLLDDKHG